MLTQQDRYEAKKMRLKAIRNEWGRRIETLRATADWPYTREQRHEYSRLVAHYTEAQERLNHFIRTSVGIHAPHRLTPTREETMRRRLARYGIKPVWD